MLLWQNSSQPIEMQQDDQYKMQITLQKVINMINNITTEKIRKDKKR